MRWYQEVGVHGSESIDDFRDEKILEAKEFTSTQRQQVNPRRLQEIHLLALPGCEFSVTQHVSFALHSNARNQHWLDALFFDAMV